MDSHFRGFQSGPVPIDGWDGCRSSGRTSPPPFSLTCSLLCYRQYVFLCVKCSVASHVTLISLDVVNNGEDRRLTILDNWIESPQKHDHSQDHGMKSVPSHDQKLEEERSCEHQYYMIYDCLQRFLLSLMYNFVGHALYDIQRPSTELGSRHVQKPNILSRVGRRHRSGWVTISF